MLFSNIALLTSLLSVATSTVYITELKTWHSVNWNCVEGQNVYRIREASPMPQPNESCDANRGGYIATSGTNGNIGDCLYDDYKAGDGYTWRFCRDSSGGGRLKGVGENFYRQCYKERGNYWLGKCYTAAIGTCQQTERAVVWCASAHIPI